MSIAKVEVINPILVNGKWIMPGIAEIDLEVANQEKAKSNVVIEEIDGVKVNGSGCCRDHG